MAETHSLHAERHLYVEHMNLKQVFLWAFLIWVCIGAVWLFPMKYKLLKRVGPVANEELIRLAKEGDEDAQRLHKYSKIFIVVGIAVLLPLYLISDKWSHSLCAILYHSRCGVNTLNS